MLTRPAEEVLPDLERRLSQHAARVRARVVLRVAARSAARRRRARRERHAAAVRVMQKYARAWRARRFTKPMVLTRARAEREARERAEAEAARVAAEEAARAKAAAEAAARGRGAPGGAAPAPPPPRGHAPRGGGGARRGRRDGRQGWPSRPSSPSTPRSTSSCSRIGTGRRRARGWGPRKVRRPRRTTGGMVSGSRTPNYDSGSEADSASGRPRRKRYSQNGWLGWATLLVLIGAYTLVALLPAFHHAGWMPFHLIYWTDEAVSAARASSRML